MSDKKNGHKNQYVQTFVLGAHWDGLLKGTNLIEIFALKNHLIEIVVQKNHLIEIVA